MKIKFTRPIKLLTLGLITIMLLTSCSSSKSNDSASENNSSIKSIGFVDENGISKERCEANKAAGEILFLTSFDYAASASILDVVVAKEKGYFDAMCLNVKLQPGFSNDNISQVSQGSVKFTSVGSVSEAAVAASKGFEVEVISTYGHTAIEALAIDGKSNIDNFEDIKGTTMGVLGSIPYSVRVMLLRNGVPLDSFKQAQASFDPTALASGNFQSRPVYVSSEPRQLDASNISYKLFKPSEYNVPASFGTIIVNSDFAKKHPSAVEDFLRADLAGYKYAVEHPQESVGYAQLKTDPKYYLTLDGENYRWQVESELIESSTPSDKPVGFLDLQQVSDELKPLTEEVKAVDSLPPVTSFIEPKYFEAIHNGKDLIWPTNLPNK